MLSMPLKIVFMISWEKAFLLYIHFGYKSCHEIICFFSSRFIIFQVPFVPVQRSDGRAQRLLWYISTCASTKNLFRFSGRTDVFELYLFPFGIMFFQIDGICLWRHVYSMFSSMFQKIRFLLFIDWNYFLQYMCVSHIT